MQSEFEVFLLKDMLKKREASILHKVLIRRYGERLKSMGVEVIYTGPEAFGMELKIDNLREKYPNATIFKHGASGISFYCPADIPLGEYESALVDGGGNFLNILGYKYLGIMRWHSVYEFFTHFLELLQTTDPDSSISSHPPSPSFYFSEDSNSS